MKHHNTATQLTQTHAHAFRTARRITTRAILTVISAGVVIGALSCNNQMTTNSPQTPPTSQSAKLDPAQPTAQQSATRFLDSYFSALAEAEKQQALTYWQAANSGKKEDFDAYAKADLHLKTLHSNADDYATIKQLLQSRSELDPLTVRSLEVAELAFKGNQLPKEILEQMVTASSDIEKTFNTFRATFEGQQHTNNELLERLSKERDTNKRKGMWEALKQVGDKVAGKIVDLAKVRNQGAKSLGYKDYWDMQVRLQEHDPEQLLSIFAQLETLTNEPFKRSKQKLDTELAKKFRIKPEQMMPWHYDNPFFQAAPPSEKVDLDDFYKGKTKEDIVAISKRFFDDIGLDIRPVLKNSDLFDRPGKDQHAFCIAVGREGDVRTLLNIKPTADWMDTMQHEQGHGVYYLGLDYTLPYNLREAAHIFTTEGIAMLFGALAKNPAWIVHYVGNDDAQVQKKVNDTQQDILEQRQREQLLFTRWTLVMLYFEKALYENPDQDLATLWWDMVEKYQYLQRPKGRKASDWASKPHFTIAPVYYHNYMLGELFAAQLRAKLAKIAKHDGPTSTLSFNGRKEFGTYLTNQVFKPGMRTNWPLFVEQATDEALTAKHFAKEVGG